NLVTIRPADATETVEAWKIALKRVDGPTALVLSRQNLPVLDRGKLAPTSGVQRGGYVLRDAAKPEIIIMGTGSEVAIALEAGELLQEKGIRARIVSLPSWELFDAQPVEYRSTVLPESIKARIAIEAGSPLGWERYVGDNGVIIGIPHFGSSAPGKVLYEKLGLTAQRVADEAANLLRGGEK
ncbi:MAG: transketolase C-terminal domain-containing protein, partial [Dehalococcoidales bacterium]